MSDIDRVCPFCLSSLRDENSTIRPDRSSTDGPDVTLYEWIPILRSLHDVDYDTLQRKIHRDDVIEKLLDAIAVINRLRGIDGSVLPSVTYHNGQLRAANTDALEESFGPQMDRILGYLSENPPSADDMMQLKVNALLRCIDDYNCAMDGVLTVTIDHSESGKNCPICLDEFVVGEEASEVPCKHVFHCKCIKTWLQMQNSCPVCRFELPLEVPRFITRDVNPVGRSRRRERRLWVHFRCLFCVGVLGDRSH